MNSRIQELAEQAEEYADAGFKGEINWAEAYESKFAELIVKECLNTLYLNGYDDAMMQLKEHFGVTQ